MAPVGRSGHAGHQQKVEEPPIPADQPARGSCPGTDPRLHSARFGKGRHLHVRQCGQHSALPLHRGHRGHLHGADRQCGGALQGPPDAETRTPPAPELGGLPLRQMRRIVQHFSHPDPALCGLLTSHPGFSRAFPRVLVHALYSGVLRQPVRIDYIHVVQQRTGHLPRHPAVHHSAVDARWCHRHFRQAPYIDCAAHRGFSCWPSHD